MGNNGWYRSNVTVAWTATDAESGSASSTGGTPATLGTETRRATNGAGLTTPVPATIKIDKTPLTIFGLPASCTLWPVDQKLVIVATVTAADSVSGLAPGAFKVTGVSNEPIALFTQFRALFVYIAEKLDPHWAPTYKYRGKIHFQANELREAVANYRRVLSLNASLPNAREELLRTEAMRRATGGK